MRTNILEVKTIIDTALKDAEISIFIGVSNRLVTETVAKEVSELLARDIETWLTAHLISVSRERQAEEEELGDAQVKYQGKYGMNLESTSYGQTALMLDTSGKLQELNKQKARITALPQWTDEEKRLFYGYRGIY